MPAVSTFYLKRWQMWAASPAGAVAMDDDQVRRMVHDQGVDLVDMTRVVDIPASAAVARASSTAPPKFFRIDDQRIHGQRALLQLLRLRSILGCRAATWNGSYHP